MIEAFGKNGVAAFDGRVLEVFGGSEGASVRVHVWLVEEIKVDGSMLVVSHNRGSAGLSYPPERAAEFEQLVAAVLAARGPAA